MRERKVGYGLELLWGEARTLPGWLFVRLWYVLFPLGSYDSANYQDIFIRSEQCGTSLTSMSPVSLDKAGPERI